MNKIKLYEVCDILNGYAFKSTNYVASGIRVIRITNVQNGCIEDKDPQFYPLSYEKEIQKYILKENDILISLTGNVGRVALLDKMYLPAALNQRVACLRLKNDIIYKSFLFHFLNSDLFENKCISNSKGIAQLNLSTEWLKNYEIPLYEFKQQIEIANKFDVLSKLIDNRKLQLIKLEELVKSRFIEMFGTYPLNSKGWNTCKIRDVVEDVRYGSSRPAVIGGKYPYLRMNNITYDGELDLTDIKYIDIPESELDKCAVRNGDVLFNRTNSRELVGKTCVYTNDEIMVLAGFIIRIRVNELVLSEFLSSFLNTDFSKQMLFNMCKTAIGQANINAQELQNIEIYLPPIKLQQEFVQFKKQIDKSKFECSICLNLLKSFNFYNHFQS